MTDDPYGDWVVAVVNASRTAIAHDADMSDYEVAIIRATMETLRENDPHALGVRRADRVRRSGTLRNAIETILADAPDDGWMNVQDITDTIIERDLYQRRDGRPLPTNQVHSLTANTPLVFEKDRGRVRLHRS